jgi:ATP-dependent Lon protease
MPDVTDQPGTAPDQSHPVIPEHATIILPVRNMLLFPGIVLPLTIGRPSSIAAAQEAVRTGRKIGLLLQDDPSIEQPGPEHLRRVGTIAEILRYVTSEEAHYIICRGLRRFRVEEFLSGFPYFVARTEEIGISEVMTPDVEARMRLLKTRAREAIQFDAISGVREFERLNAAVQAPRLKVPIAECYPLTRAYKAHERLAEGQVVGKIILAVHGS